jgi:hypothetical protein
MDDLWKLQESLRRDPIVLQTVLRLDSMFLEIARRSLSRAAELQPQVQTARGECQELMHEAERILEAHGGDPFKAYESLERVYIAQEGANARLAYAYSPVIEALAQAHISCAAALESHINLRASALLAAEQFKEFDRLDLKTKWSALPDLLGKPGFDRGAEPFQSFATLVSFRNALVHYREHKEVWTDPGEPTFLPKLGLSTELATKSVDAVVGMIRRLAEVLGNDVPYWLTERENLAYFECR